MPIDIDQDDLIYMPEWVLKSKINKNEKQFSSCDRKEHIRIKRAFAITSTVSIKSLFSRLIEIL